jgi:hypothetical protein
VIDRPFSAAGINEGPSEGSISLAQYVNLYVAVVLPISIEMEPCKLFIYISLEGTPKKIVPAKRQEARQLLSMNAKYFGPNGI